ncbi:MAG: hypothetical protein JWO55_767 [Candidatus Saccharibacteria bacterium]|jgi:hypothetical protein|nr:hypothetical protein [Candidatus Saccharibacteria bacterium]
MQQEQYTPRNFDQPSQHSGTVFEHNDQIDLHASELEAQRARADIDAATQSHEEKAQQGLEHAPLSPQEVVRTIGLRVVFELRKGYQDRSLNLEDEELAPTSELFNPENGQPDQYLAKSRNTADQSKISSKEDFDLAA